MRNWTIAALPLTLALAACNGTITTDEGGKGRSADPGPTTTQDFALTGFTGVEVTGPDDVTIRQGDAFSISAKGPKAEIDDLEIKLDGTTLSIGRKRSGFSFGGRDHDEVEIAITMPRLGAVKLTGSGSIDADTIDGNDVAAVLTGSGDLKVAKFSGAKAKLTVSGSGDIEIAGGAIKSGDLDVTGSGDIDAKGLAAETLDISVTGSGNIAAQATASADISILGSGDVDLTGGAACTTKAMGSGTATCK
ncbi:head GIN domain-containing protein [Sphingopyxis sp. PET50]|uniref:head GIN domain-containing protein n=1 Tax=Sphingopyxis sp. PET50 TaxID=2976533 RepID=UPI0021AFA3D4|nr:head GIN domain-containing protein [Sphingopyxis sp. PET50]